MILSIEVQLRVVCWALGLDALVAFVLVPKSRDIAQHTAEVLASV